MKKIKPSNVLLIFAVSSLLLIQGIYGYFTKVSDSHENSLTISQKAKCTVIHEFMDLNGTTYSERSREVINNLLINIL